MQTRTQCPRCLQRWVGTTEQVIERACVCMSCLPGSAEQLFEKTKAPGEFWTWNSLPPDRKQAYLNAVGQ